MAGRQGEPMMGTDPATWKWVNVAEPGTFNGHPSGPFTLDNKVFEDIVRNFKADGLPIAFDLEHASEMDSSSGSIPVTGAPAQGWIHDLDNRGPAGLWALVEWGEQAKDYIRTGKYKFCSPAVRFGCKDRVTGKPIGARMTSVAMTNNPFLKNLDVLAAKDRAAATAAQATIVAMRAGLTAPLHQPHEYMPALKSALKLDALCSPKDCADKLDRLRECCMSVGMDGVHMGEPMAPYVSSLSQLVGATPGMSGEELFDIIEDLISHAIEQHVAEMHPGAAPMGDDDPTGDMTMADPTISTLLKDTQTAALSDAEFAEGVKLGLEAAPRLNAALLKFYDVPGIAKRASDAETVVKSAGALLVLKDGETLAQGIQRVLDENKALLADKVARDDADLAIEVEDAFETYKDEKKLKDGDKPHMLSFAKTNRAAFVAMYPPVPAAQRHLLRTVTPTEPTRVLPPALVVVPTIRETIRRLMTEEKMSYGDAQIEATRIVRAAQRKVEEQAAQAGQ